MAAKRKSKEPKDCGCIDAINKLLAPKNGVLTGHLRLNGAPRRIYVSIEKLDVAVRMKPPYLAANHCPFCGKKLPG